MVNHSLIFFCRVDFDKFYEDKYTKIVYDIINMVSNVNDKNLKTTDEITVFNIYVKGAKS